MRTKRARVLTLGMACGAALVGCSDSESSGDGSAPDWAVASATIEGQTYGVRDVVLTLEVGDGQYFNLSGTPTEQPDEDCVIGLSGGMNLYGDIPPVGGAAELVGQSLPVEFSGDGDDANLCFVGTNGLLGAEAATLTIDAVDGERARFTMSGQFQRYDEEGNPTPVQASASGTALVDTTTDD